MAGERILVVDDDTALAADVAAHLRGLGHAVAEAANVAEARQLRETGQPALCLVDILMPGTSGRVFCAELAERSTAGIIMMSSLSDTDTITALLEIGADDYIVKPFRMEEMAARVRAVLRRRGGGRAPAPGGAEAEVARLGAWGFEPAARRLVSDSGESVALTPSEISLLRFLVANPGVVFSREDILAVSRTRQHGGASDRSVDNLVKRLRRKLGQDRDGPQSIETVWGKGFRYNQDV